MQAAVVILLLFSFQGFANGISDAKKIVPDGLRLKQVSGPDFGCPQDQLIWKAIEGEEILLLSPSLEIGGFAAGARGVDEPDPLPGPGCIFHHDIQLTDRSITYNENTKCSASFIHVRQVAVLRSSAKDLSITVQVGSDATGKFDPSATMVCKYQILN